MPSVEAVSLAGTSMFLENCNTVGAVMAKIAVAHQRLATDVTIMDLSGELLDLDERNVPPKVNFVILDERKVLVDIDPEMFSANISLHAEQNDLQTCSMVAKSLLELRAYADGMYEADSELEFIVQNKFSNWQAATKILLQAGVSGQKALRYAVMRGCVESFEILLQCEIYNADRQKEIERSLMHAVYTVNSQTQIVKTLLAAKAPINVDGPSLALIEASVRGRGETVDALLAAKADIREKDPSGNPVLNAACRGSGCADVAKSLLNARVDINASGVHGRTSLIEASARGFSEVVAVLLASGADCNATSECGRTALMEASENGFAVTVEALIAAGANMYAMDKNGKTAVSVAQEHVKAILAKEMETEYLSQEKTKN